MEELFEKIERLFNVKNGDMSITNIDQWRKNQLQHIKKEYFSNQVEPPVSREVGGKNERDRILNLLKLRRRGFLDNNKFGRAETLKELIDGIESGKITDYTYLEDCGLSITTE